MIVGELRNFTRLLWLYFTEIGGILTREFLYVTSDNEVIEIF